MKKVLCLILILMSLSACSKNAITTETVSVPEISTTIDIAETSSSEESSTVGNVLNDPVPPTSKDFTETAEGRAVVRETFSGEECAYIKYDEMDELTFSPLSGEDYGIDTFQQHPQYDGIEVIDGIMIINPMANIYLEKDRLIIQKEDSTSMLDLRGLLEGEIANAGTYTPNPDLEANQFERYILPNRLAFYQIEKTITLFIHDIDVMGQSSASYILRIDLENLKLENIIPYFEWSITDIIDDENRFYILIKKPQIPENYKIIVLDKISLEQIYISEEQEVSEMIDPYGYVMGHVLVIDENKLYITNAFSETEREMVLDITEFDNLSNEKIDDSITE